MSDQFNFSDYPYTNFNEVNLDWVTKTAGETQALAERLQNAADSGEFDGLPGSTIWLTFEEPITTDTYAFHLTELEGRNVIKQVGDLIVYGNSYYVIAMITDTYAICAARYQFALTPSEEDIQAAADNWLSDNIDPATGYALDNSLSLANAAAPASLVGDLKTNSLKLLGSFSTLGYTAFSDVQETGFVSFTTSNLASITDKPSDLTAGGIIINFKPISGRYQILQSVRKIWIRNITQSGTVGNWTSLTEVDTTLSQSGIPADAASVGDILSTAYLGFRGNMSGQYTAFADFRMPGYINFTSSFTSSITDKPSDLSAGGICVNFPTASAYYQLIISTRGHYWIRNLTSNGAAGLWYPLFAPYFPVWIAIGDSITEGTYSEIGGTQGAGQTSDNYVNLIAQYNGYTVTNLGDGGMGLLATGSGTGKNGKQICDSALFTGADLVTIALGTNDWKHYQFGSASDSTSANTCAGALKYCIEKVMDKNPSCKLIVIGPMNQYRNTNATWNTNWALNFDAGYGTLQQFIGMEKSVCDFYGVEFLDMTKIGPVNRQNISTLLGDGMHPTIAGYALIAKSVRKEIHI